MRYRRLYFEQPPSVFGSSDRKWIDFVNKMAVNYKYKSGPGAATLEHHPNIFIALEPPFVAHYL